ncbi:MAG: hypothetical protein K6F30_02775 [Lachnospiraceae bacterium]|nr:hypothetical protein [Lachnospiraceae bacterium]
MIITSGDVGMRSSRSFETRSSYSTTITTSQGNNTSGIWNSTNTGLSGNFMGLLNYSLEDVQKNTDMNKETGLLGGITDGNGRSNASRGVTQTRDLSELKNSALRIQFETLNYLFKVFFSNRFGVPTEMSNRSFDTFMGGENSYEYFENQRTQTFEQIYTYEENETTTFSTQGTVCTADGREIGFGINVTMTRSFYQEYRESYTRNIANYLDPLVINLDGNVTNVTDQTFIFDLDSDGNEDEIHALGKGSGFLALDKNGDGVINNGSELFGARTGNGFEELATYDLDGNGWIDEADEIFSRLKVWAKDEDGKDVLYTLKEAGVGAICLSAQQTNFNLTNEENESKAMIRQSGFFLRENGIPGLVQQVDMAM